MGDLPRESPFAFLVGSGLASGFLEIGGGAHVDEEFHLMFFVFVRDDVRSEAELRLEFGEFHVFGELAFSLHLLEILIVLIFIFGV